MIKFWRSFFYKNHNERMKSEKILLIKNFEYKNNTIDIYLSINNKINLNDLEKLCDSVGWVRRPLRKVQIALKHSFLITYIFYYKKNKKQIIGFARATSDNSFNATIWDVVIHPEFQGKGLGKELMNQLIKELRYYDISTITLFADPQVVKFYKHLGFIMDPDGIKGMFWYPL